MNSQQAINLLKGLEQSLDDYCELNDEGKAAFRMAITALELFGNSEQLPSAQPECKQECMPMYADVSDCISRQAAIDEAYEIIIDGQKFEVVQVETLMGLPPAQQWIPTSKTETIPDHEVLCCDRYENQMVGYLTNDHGEWICESDSEVMYDTVAWMEKPPSYKELDDD